MTEEKYRDKYGKELRKYPGSEEINESCNQYFCGLLRALNENEIEMVVEKRDLADNFLDWIGMD